MNKIYLVITNYANDSGSGIDMSAYKNYEDAKKDFDLSKEDIKSFQLGYNTIEDEKDYYCEYEEGYYSSNHELVYIKELEVK
jgi:hypothetical protein